LLINGITKDIGGCVRVTSSTLSSSPNLIAG
jgi:hypothetical protein